MIGDDDDAILLLELDEHEEQEEVSTAQKSIADRKKLPIKPQLINFSYLEYAESSSSNAKKPRHDTTMEQVDQAIRDNVLAQAIDSVGLTPKRKPVTSFKKNQPKLQPVQEP